MSSIFKPTGGGTERISTQTGGQANLLDLLTGVLGGQFQGGQLQGVTPFQGTRPGEVPFSPLQQQGFGLAGGLQPLIQQGFDVFEQGLQFDPSQGQQFLGQAGGALQQGLDFDPTQNILEAFEPSRQLALRGFQQDIVPNLLERFGATSGPSGPLNRALAEAGAGLELGLSAQTAPFIGQAALQQPGVQFQGAQLGGQLAGIPGQLAQQQTQLGSQGAGLLSGLLNIGGAQQQLPIGIAGAEQARFLEAQGFANPFLAQFLGPALGTSAFQAFQKPSGPPMLGQITGAIGDLFGSGGAFGQGGAFGPTPPPQASDIRLKEDLASIDNALDKIEQLDGKTYHFVFKPKTEFDAGLIAQDIEKVLPEAIVEKNGIKYVKYEAIVGLLINAVKELKRKVG